MSPEATPEERLSTGVPGLDDILAGGYRRGRTYMVMGLPGAGKTILANQTCFHHARGGGRVLYVTLLAESHTELMTNLQPLKFFDAAALPENIAYLSGFAVLEEGGLEGLMALIRRELKRHSATLLVLDGLVAAEELAPTAQALKKFIHGVQMVTSLMGCTTLFLTTGGGQGLRAEHTMVDGLIVLYQHNFGVRAVRELSVRKFRGSPHAMGRHAFEISGAGITVYPRLETVALSTPAPRGTKKCCGFGIRGLDEMLHGGLPIGSATMMLGSPGSGKTLLGLHFLADGANKGERVHYQAFYDSPERMVEQAGGVGLDLEKHLKSGLFSVAYHAPTENLLDQIGSEMLRAVREQGVKRLFLDGFDALQRATFRPRRTARFLAALINECRVRGVTFLYSVETDTAFADTVTFPVRGVSMISENILFTRTAEIGPELRRIICALKIRNSGYDPTLRELVITSKGLAVGDPLPGDLLLTGLARTSGKAPRKRRLLKRRTRK